MKLRSIVLTAMLALFGVATHAADLTAEVRSTLPRLTLTPDLNDFNQTSISDLVVLRLEQLAPKVEDSAPVAVERAAQLNRWSACLTRSCYELIEHDFELTVVQQAVSNVGRPGQSQRINQATASNVFIYLDSRKPVGMNLTSPEGNAWVLKTLRAAPTSHLDAMDELQNMRTGVRELRAHGIAESTLYSKAAAGAGSLTEQVAAMGAKGGADFMKYLSSLPAFNAGANHR